MRSFSVLFASLAVTSAIKCSGTLPHAEISYSGKGTFPVMGMMPLFNDKEADQVKNDDCITAMRGVETNEAGFGMKLPDNLAYFAIGKEIVTRDMGVFDEKAANCPNLPKFIDFINDNLDKDIKTTQDLAHNNLLACVLNYKKEDGSSAVLFLGGDDPLEHTFANGVQATSGRCCVDFKKNGCGMKKK